MEKNSTRKKNGVYYTPSNLAEYLAKGFIGTKRSYILDPSYGEGALLLAAERVLAVKNNKNQLFGCDTKPVNGLLNHLPSANLKRINFFDFSVENKFELVLMNPPYVRHHYLNGKDLERYKQQIPSLGLLNSAADLWAYFIIKAIEHLKIGGSIGAILPWSFLQADYSQKLRFYLSERFEKISVLSLSDKYFEGTEERVVLLWLKNYGTKNSIISIASANSINDKVTFNNISLDSWTINKVPYTGNTSSLEILKLLKRDFAFKNFGYYADVKIGVVTAGNKFFIRKLKDFKIYGISKKNLIPIVTNAKGLADYFINKTTNLKYLAYLDSKHYNKYRKFILEGTNKKLNLTAHALERKPWYKVKIGSVPDAFFPYRMSMMPILIPNNCSVLCTNSIHRIYYKNLSKTEIRWLEVSILSSFGQLSLEVNSKTYGRGILKVEPSSLKNTLVYVSKDKLINSVYPEIKKALLNNNKKEARKLATNFMASFLNIPSEMVSQIELSINSYENLRLQRKT